MKQLIIILFFSILHNLSFAQDTVHKRNDSVAAHRRYLTQKDSAYLDSLRKAQDNIFKNSFQRNDSVTSASAKKIIIDSTTTDTVKHDSIKIIKPVTVKIKPAKKSTVVLLQGTERNLPDRDVLFYILIFLVFFLGLIKTSFPKYVNSIFSLSFQATFRQTQTKEQMSQNFFPAFMLNLLFVLCGGLFITQFATFTNRITLPFWQLFTYSTIILLIIYAIKNAVIIFTGWVFNAKDAAMEYRFVVFLINKVLAILIIPLLFLIAYADYAIQNIAITIVLCLAVFSLAVRYLVSLSRIRKNLNVHAFHFFIYLCAVEIMPLLVIYKILFLQASNT